MVKDNIGYRPSALGCRMAEFPIDHATASEAIVGGDATVLGAPNVIRGGSHLNRPGAAEAAAGLCSVLRSDYYYPWLYLIPLLPGGPLSGVVG
jgi:alpha-D-ribose 1-methylphosphonate 5-triphosphate diphosphatase